jgi:hypothetical protein
MQERLKSVKGSRVILVLLLVFVVSLSIPLLLYFVVWKIPDNSGEIEVLNIASKHRIDKANTLPVDENGWFYYSEALEKMIISRDSPEQQPVSSIIKNGVNADNYEKVQKILKENEVVLELADKGFSQPGFHVPFDYSQGLMNSRMSYTYETVKQLTDFLILTAKLEIFRGNFSGAARRYAQILSFARGIGQNRMLIDTMISTSIYNNVLPHIRRMLLDMPADNAEIPELVLVEMKIAERTKDFFINTIDNELLVTGITFDLVKNKKQPLPHEIAKQIRSLPLGLVIDRERRAYENWFLNSRKAVMGDYRDFQVQFKSFKMPPFVILAPIIIMNIDGANTTFLRSCVEFDGIMLLAALRKFMAVKGQYPDRLEDLVPEYLSQLPEDPFSPDKKFIYKKSSDSMILYSVGPDMTDDGGSTLSDRSSNTGDIVFTR